MNSLVLAGRIESNLKSVTYDGKNIKAFKLKFKKLYQRSGDSEPCSVISVLLFKEDDINKVQGQKEGSPVLVQGRVQVESRGGKKVTILDASSITLLGDNPKPASQPVLDENIPF